MSAKPFVKLKLLHHPIIPFPSLLGRTVHQQQLQTPTNVQVPEVQLQMSTSSIFSGSLPASRTSILEGKNCSSKVNTEAVEEIITTLKDAVPPAVEYTLFKHTTVPSLAEILSIYPVIEAIASRLISDDLLSLSLVSKDIHQALGQSTTKSYWKHLIGKCSPLLCYMSGCAGSHERPCLDVQRCLRCKKGVCSVSPLLAVSS